MLTQGDTAPDFMLPDESSESVSLDDLVSSGPAAIYFYPADFTPVCTAEACSFRDMHPALQQAGVRLAGISPQNQASHDRFKTKFSLPFTLLSDCEKRVIKRYGANGPFGLGVRRVTYLITPDKRIAAAHRADLSAKAHTRFIERAIQEVTSAGK